ncbi:hypothetical protein AJ85_06690 [Alkalihalobacillus alcalophilus ATCC 27647 = CGMCC 1.3604]|uniref:Gluconeogenesis factor n=1 Tax=Alkalihalobacillus alcalophilus ATCC 27647 = CGMCC 1.3604 TaxID=1218173 RepID=A0A094XFJ3_ALKAL|nr:YvcK family protein [Alkalihalobacillus alcalophilus]KGA97560.1 hypothetical protein BALCAV_0209385 [Alkalihalobacillus alcalophilus ATCC 27647 = CGMCC 1.3604]MED1562976.1 YvcK family protein [Alkalihalobacillus alcalophilus]THG91127.1 hypothetical protein AJ85_06690 [Alkalihalobacillus alcalophilus ATCC 27647 = CGMCC 1.3604]
MNKRIVVIGGGTGLSVLLRGLKTFPVDITAIVTVADDGGSSGRLRKELDVPPPGDIRNVLVALAEVEPLVEQLFQHRFENGNGLSGHSLGNLLLAGMTSITGDFANGISEISKVLNVRGKVLPAANRSVVLHAEMVDGSIVTGESTIPKSGKRIKRVFLTPEKIYALSECLRELKRADLIVLGPGSLYTSVLPNLLVPGIVETIVKSRAPKVYISNVMTQKGETDHYTAADHLEGILSHCGENVVDHILVHGTPVSESVKKKYALEDAAPVEVDEHKLKQSGVNVIRDHFVIENEDVLRHDAVKVSKALLNIMRENN